MYIPKSLIAALILWAIGIAGLAIPPNTPEQIGAGSALIGLGTGLILPGLIELIRDQLR